MKLGKFWSVGGMRAGGAPLGSATGNGHLLTKNLDIWAKLLITSVCSYESDLRPAVQKVVA